MRSLLVALAAAAGVQATALTAILPGSERSCYYADVDGVGEKIGFYFAVQSGGNFEVDYIVNDPDDKILFYGGGEKQGDFIFTANKIGEYSFCFDNAGSSADKLLDFDIMVESEPRRTVATQKQPLKEHTSSLEESTYKLSGLFANIIRTQKYFHTRHHRNYSTVQSTQSRIFWFTALESAIIIGMSFVQIWILKTFFTGSGKGRYRV